MAHSSPFLPLFSLSFTKKTPSLLKSLSDVLSLLPSLLVSSINGLAPIPKVQAMWLFPNRAVGYFESPE